MSDLSFLDWPWAQKEEKEQFYSVTPVMVGREVQSLLVTCSAGFELLYLGKVSQASQESQIRGSKNCQFLSWCSFLLITPAFPLNHLAYVCTVLCEKQMMLWINDFHSWHLEDLYPLLCVLPLLGKVQASLTSSSHCATALFLSLIPVSFLLLRVSTSPPSPHYLMPIRFYLMWTFVCWHLGCSIINAMKHCDSSNRLLLADRIILLNIPSLLWHLFSQEGASFCSHNWIFLAES